MMNRVFYLSSVALLFPLLALAQSERASFSGAAGLHAVDARSPEGLQDLFRYTGEAMPLLSAHRGGAQPGYPENCIATFEHTLRHAYSMLEIDLRYSKDGVMVLNHDPTLDRTTTGSGPVSALTLEELKALRLKDLEGNPTEHQISTLDEALEWARGKTILVLDVKEVPVEAAVKKIEEHRAEAYAMIMAYNFEAVRQVYDLNPSIMMEAMIGDRSRFEAFEKAGVPWRNVFVFVSHSTPDDPGLLEMIHAKGALCMAGTSRNLDKELWRRRGEDTTPLAQGYRDVLGLGIDLIETDIPVQVGGLIYAGGPVPASKAKYFKAP